MVKVIISQAEEVESRLREMILNMDLGPGERLTERWAESHLGASRTPIRTALIRLVNEGLVTREGRGWIVTPLNAREMEQLFVYRKILETAAIRLALPNISLDIVRELENDFCQPGIERNRDEAHQFGTSFHMRLAQLSGNEFIYKSIGDTINRLSRARWLDTESDHDGWIQHRKIIDALKNANVDLATELLEHHIDDSKNRLLTLLSNMKMSIRARGGIVI